MATPQYEIGKPYKVIAHNAQHQTNNRMHLDGLPQKLGFRGALVLGLATYGNMTRALVATYGEAWLGKAFIYVKFKSVVCEGDVLRVETDPVEGKPHTFKVVAYNEFNGGVPAAEMETSIPAELPPLEPHAALQPNEWEGPVTQKRTWDNVVIEKPYRSLRTTLSATENAHWIKILGDEQPIYYEGDRPALHPTHVLRQVQLASGNQYLGDTAVHGWTRAVIRKMLRIGDAVNVLAVPVEKWDKKGNHWVRMYCAVRVNGETYAEMFHCQIFKVRGSDGN
jgi:acyl dehydratase